MDYCFVLFKLKRLRKFIYVLWGLGMLFVKNLFNFMQDVFCSWSTFPHEYKKDKQKNKIDIIHSRAYYYTFLGFSNGILLLWLHTHQNTLHFISGKQYRTMFYV